MQDLQAQCEKLSISTNSFKPSCLGTSGNATSCRPDIEVPWDRLSA
jgi:hypothetical protein